MTASLQVVIPQGLHWYITMYQTSQTLNISEQSPVHK